MKIKRLFSGIGLGLFAFAAVGAGLVGAKAKKVEPVKADGEWMFRVQFNSHTAGEWTGEDTISNVKFHYWGDGGVDAWADLGPCGLARWGSTVYGTNIVLGASQTVNGGQFTFDQKGNMCYSLNLDNCTFSAEDTSNRVREWHYYDQDWTEDGGSYKWHTFYDGSTDAPRITMTDMPNQAFTPNPSKKRWEVKNWVFEATEKTLDQRFLIFDLGPKDYSVSMLTDETKAEFGTDGTDVNACWYRLPDYGTHDFFLEAESSGSGQMVIRKQGTADTVNIYYVLQNNTPTDDYIYSWGGEKQFGSWPGTKITDIVGVEEVTNNCILKFQGYERLIYKIPVKVGAPGGDTQFKFNAWEGDKSESDARPISGHNAYWWSGNANSDAGYSLEFLLRAEKVRNSAADYSVCNISKGEAISIVNDYASLGSYMQTEYINCSTVWTYKVDKAARVGEDVNENVSYRKVIEELARIAELEALIGLSPSYFFAETANNTNIVIIISVVALVSVSSLSLLVVLKKRKHN